MLPESFGGRIIYLLQQYGPSFLKGAGVSMWLALVGTLFGCIIGFLVGIVQTIPVDKNDSTAKKVIIKVVKFIMACYVEFFRGTPMMAQAMFIYFGSAYLFNINMSMWFAAIFIVSINTGAYMAETVRGGILSIDPGQTEGAKAIGMTHVQTMINVILPQALRNIMPQIGNNLIINIKDTCVLSIIGTVELFYTTKGVAGALYTYLPIIEVVKGNTESNLDEAAFTDVATGTLVNSGFLDGLSVTDAKKKMIEWLEANGIIKQKRFKKR